jgi:Fe-S-cluster containining protein
MRSKNPQTKEGKQCSKDMLWVIENTILKMDTPKTITTFHMDEHEIFQNLLYQIRRDCPKLTKDPDAIQSAVIEFTQRV